MAKKPEQMAFDRIMRRFDFQKVATAMRAVGWTWLNSPVSPTVEELRANVRDKFEYLRKNPKSRSIASGGLYLGRSAHDDMKFLHLEFVLADEEQEI